MFTYFLRYLLLNLETWILCLGWPLATLVSPQNISGNRWPTDPRPFVSTRSLFGAKRDDETCPDWGCFDQLNLVRQAGQVVSQQMLQISSETHNRFGLFGNLSYRERENIINLNTIKKRIPDFHETSSDETSPSFAKTLQYII